MPADRALELADGLERLASGAVECEADERFLCEAAALLRSQAADAKRLTERLEVVEREANWDREVAHPDQVERLRRKVAYYVGRARACMKGRWWYRDIVDEQHEQDAEVLARYRADADALAEALRAISVKYQETLDMMRRHGWSYTDTSNQDQKMAFSIYGDLVECCEAARAALARHDGGKG